MNVSNDTSAVAISDNCRDVSVSRFDSRDLCRRPDEDDDDFDVEDWEDSSEDKVSDAEAFVS